MSGACYAGSPHPPPHCKAGSLRTHSHGSIHSPCSLLTLVEQLVACQYRHHHLLLSKGLATGMHNTMEDALYWPDVVVDDVGGT